MKVLRVNFTGKISHFSVHDCKMTGLFNPQNGEFKLQSGLTTYSAMATFECLSGYELVGLMSRICTLDGWNGTNPSCSKDDS